MAPLSSQATPSLPAPSRAEPRSEYLAGLDGLRAVSVLAVMAYHAGLPGTLGGFLGVEVFFVISGFLITTQLLRELDDTGTVSLRRFWMRRIRRLQPALLLLLVFWTLVVIAREPQLLAELRSQLAAALGFVTNWFLIVTQQSYFASGERPPVLQHLWSLAVEEQFYILWPLIVLGLAKLLGRRRPWIALVLGLGATVSVARMAALGQPGTDPSRAYYGTDTRAAGLLLGALMALAWRPGRGFAGAWRLRSWQLDLLGILGLLGLGVAFHRLVETHPWLLRGGFTLTGLLSGAVILAGAQPGTRLGRLLGNRPLAWIGVRSYGLYLWHWPIFLFVPGGQGPRDRALMLALRLGLTFAAAGLSYRYVEAPIRHGVLGRWFRGLGAPQAGRRRLLAAATALVSCVGLAALARPVLKAGKVLGEVERSIQFGQEAVPPPAPAAAAALPTPACQGPKAITVLGDSVLLGAQSSLKRELEAEGWRVDVRGRPALMVHQAARELAEARVAVSPTVVVGLGYNSLWEREGRNRARWNAQFDREAERLLQVLQGLGARRVVWVDLREPTRELVPEKALWQFEKYAWYYAFVNERIRELPRSHPEVRVAPWSGVSRQKGITYDSIHLNPMGVRLMIDTIRDAAGI
ncbi:MAG TPA: acyltransferase family protein [Holophaga sp.]|nr:acyltransferase family protein [Holophaga sp.]